MCELLKRTVYHVATVKTWLVLVWALLSFMLPHYAHAATQVQWQLDKPVYASNERIRASFEGVSTPGTKHWLGIWSYPDSGPRAGAWDRATNGGRGSLQWSYLPADAAGEVRVEGLPPGRYVAFLLADDGYEWLAAPIIFWVTEDGAPQRESGSLLSDRRTYEEGDAVSLSYSGITAAPRNWIGVWRYSDGPGANADGPWSFAQSNSSDPWKYVTDTGGGWNIPSLPAGTYAAFMLANDGYEWLAPPAIFEVKAEPIDPDSLIGPPEFNGKSTELKVLQFNVWLRGTGVGAGGPDMVADVIRDTGADVVTLSESGSAYAQRLVNDLAKRGYKFNVYGPDKDVSVVSRYPILETGEFNRFSKAVIDVNGTPVSVYSGHLEYQWYVCYLPRGYGGGTPAGNETSEYGWGKISTGPITDVNLILDLNEKSGRPESIRQFIADAEQELGKGRLVVVAGDFNEPSHLDWSEATKDLYDHHGAVVPWQSTTLLENAGYLDSYRVLYPDPVTHPGFTWPSDNPAVPVSRLTWAPEADERDRIDYVFYQPDARLSLQAVTVVGPSSSIVRNQRVEETGDDPFLKPLSGWPTDHKSVMATFVVKPMALTLPELAGGTQHQAYGGSLSVLGGVGPYTYKVVDGSLPPGVELSVSGEFSGAPTASGRYAFTVEVRDANGGVAEREYVIEVAASGAAANLQPVPTMSETVLWLLSFLLIAMGLRRLKY